MSLFYDALFKASMDGHESAINEAAKAIPLNSPLGVIAAFFHGCGILRRNEVEAGIATLQAAAVGAAHCAKLFEMDPRLISIESQGHIICDFPFVEALRSDSQLVALPEVRFESDEKISAIDAPFVYVASCNPLYLEKFGAMFVAACDAVGIRTVVHLHVVDPTDQTEEIVRRLAAGLRNITLNYSTELFVVKGAIGYRRSSYYANARFVCADQLISRYDRDLMILDIDITKIGDVAALVGVMKNYDFGYFSCGDIFPWLICRAAAVYVRREGSGRAFLQLVARYILSKIENEGFWGLDQAALYVVSRFLASTSDFRHVDLSEALGTSLEQYITLDMNESEKQQLRKAAHA